MLLRIEMRQNTGARAKSGRPAHESKSSNERLLEDVLLIDDIT